VRKKTRNTRSDNNITNPPRPAPPSGGAGSLVQGVDDFEEQLRAKDVVIEQLRARLRTTENELLGLERLYDDLRCDYKKAFREARELRRKLRD